jgi:hypothetical protein
MTYNALASAEMLVSRSRDEQGDYINGIRPFLRFGTQGTKVFILSPH